MAEILTSPIRYVPRRASTVGNLVSPSAFQVENKENESWLSMAGFSGAGIQDAEHATVTTTFKSVIIAGYIDCIST